MSAAHKPVIDPERLLPVESVVPEFPDETESRFSDLLGESARWIGKTRSEFQGLLAFAYQRSRDASQSFVIEVRDRSRKMRDERPILLLSIIAGSAFAAGLGAAVWRSRRS